jgi:hypothetical protein
MLLPERSIKSIQSQMLSLQFQEFYSTYTIRNMKREMRLRLPTDDKFKARVKRRQKKRKKFKLAPTRTQLEREQEEDIEEEDADWKPAYKLVPSQPVRQTRSSARTANVPTKPAQIDEGEIEDVQSLLPGEDFSSEESDSAHEFDYLDDLEDFDVAAVIQQSKQRRNADLSDDSENSDEDSPYSSCEEEEKTPTAAAKPPLTMTTNKRRTQQEGEEEGGPSLVGRMAQWRLRCQSALDSLLRPPTP